MAPILPGSTRRYASIVSLAPAVARLAHEYFTDDGSAQPARHTLAKRELHGTQKTIYIVLIPVLVLLSGLFAGLTLGYMSLDETQLQVLAVSGTPKQQAYAKKIMPVRKNGHLLLVTLLLANMIVNETLPVISDPVLGGGVQSVVVSTILIVIFSEIIPQSVCTRYGLAVGATMAPFTQVLLWTIGLLGWPVAKFLEFILGAHHGVMYRRAELKELINMHSATASHGGDLKRDTVTIIGAALDLEEKNAQHAMTPIDDVFMLPMSARLDRETLTKIVETGHSRVPVYVEVDVPVFTDEVEVRKERVKKIVGILLVKHCLLYDPKEAKPLSTVPLNRVLFVPQNEPLLGILDCFQEGRSHMAVVTRFSKEVAKEVKKEVKKGFSQRIKDRVGMTDSSDESSSDEEKDGKDEKKQPKSWGSGPEQSMPADALLAPDGQKEIMRSVEGGVMPLGIITLEDVLEEIIGEEIYDEFDSEGASPELIGGDTHKKSELHAHDSSTLSTETTIANPQPAVAKRRIPFLTPRSKSLPPDGPLVVSPGPLAASALAPPIAEADPRPASPAPMTEDEKKAMPSDDGKKLAPPKTVSGVLQERRKPRDASLSKGGIPGSPRIGGKGRYLKSQPIEPLELDSKKPEETHDPGE